jgi:hypothetical protein
MQHMVNSMIGGVLENNCHNPSLGLATKARVCKGVGQEGSLGVRESVRMDIHTSK